MTIFVNPTSPTNGTGTLIDPRNTPLGINWSSDSDFAFCAGTTWNANNAFSAVAPDVPGTPTARKRIRSYAPGTGEPTTEKAKIVNASRYGINFGSNNGYYDVEDLDISEIGNGSADFCWGIANAVSPADDSFAMETTIRRCHIHDLRNGAADVGGMSLRGRGNTVDQCWIWGIPTDGIRANGQFLTVRRSRIEKINTDGRNQADCIQTASDAGGLLIEDNYLDGRDAIGKQVIILQNASPSPIPMRVLRNTLIGPANSLQNLIADQNSPLLVSGNIFVDGMFGCRVRGGARVVGNLFLNLRTVGQYHGVWLETTDNQVAANNTFLNFAGIFPSQRAVYCETAHSNHTLANNLVVGFETGFRTALAQVILNNVFSGTSRMQSSASDITANPSNRVVTNIWDYINRDGTLKTPVMVDGIPMLNPLGNAGMYLDGVRLMGGQRLNAYRPVVGAFGEGRY